MRKHISPCITGLQIVGTAGGRATSALSSLIHRPKCDDSEDYSNNCGNLRTLATPSNGCWNGERTIDLAQTPGLIRKLHLCRKSFA